MNPAQHILILLVRLYRRTLSPAKVFLFGPLGNCRFEPSCSQYALEALKTHGAVSGSWLAVKRICRCNPYGGCGHDPVPPKRSFSNPLPSDGRENSNSPIQKTSETFHSPAVVKWFPLTHRMGEGRDEDIQNPISKAALASAPSK